MSEPIFFKHNGGLTVGEIAALSGAMLARGELSARKLTNLAPLDRASPDDLIYLDDARDAAVAARTYAGACLTTAALAPGLPARVAVLVVAEPYAAFVAAARALFPDALRPSSLYAGATAPGAQVHPSARLESGVVVEPGAVIGAQVEIGAGTVIAANAVIGPQVRIGRDGAVGAGASIYNALIGDRVVVHAGCVIGQDGFGFLAAAAGHLKVPQVGRVIIQDGVEIGAGTVIARGAFGDTVIGEGSKIDNLVQVGHNVAIGRHCLVGAQSGLAGRSIVEDFAVLGAQVGLSENVRIAEGAHVAAAGARGG